MKSAFENEFFCGPISFINFDFKIGVEVNLRMIMKNHAADPEIKFLTNSIEKPYGRAKAMPVAWELTLFSRRINRVKI